MVSTCRLRNCFIAPREGSGDEVPSLFTFEVGAEFHVRLNGYAIVPIEDFELYFEGVEQWRRQFLPGFVRESGAGRPDVEDPSR